MSSVFSIINELHNELYSPFTPFISKEYNSVRKFYEDIYNSSIINTEVEIIRKNKNIVVVFSESHKKYYIIASNKKQIEDYYNNYVIFTLNKIMPHPTEHEPIQQYVSKVFTSVRDFVQLSNQKPIEDTIHEKTNNEIRLVKERGFVVIYSNSLKQYVIVYNNELSLQKYLNFLNKPSLIYDTMDVPKEIKAVFFDFDLTLTPEHTYNYSIPMIEVANSHLRKYPVEMNFIREKIQKLKDYVDIFILSRGIVSDIIIYLRQIGIDESIIPDSRVLGAQTPEEVNPTQDANTNTRFWANKKREIMEKYIIIPQYYHVLFMDDTPLNVETARSDNISTILAIAGKPMENLEKVFKLLRKDISMVGGYKNKYLKYKYKYLKLKL